MDKFSKLKKKEVIKLKLHFQITNQHLKLLEKKEYLVNKSHNYIQLFFEFQTEDWTPLINYCQLKNTKGETYQFYITDDGIYVPAQVLNGEYFIVSVYGSDNNTRITTNRVYIQLRKCGYTTDISDLTPEPEDVIVQLFERIQEVEDSISTVGHTGSWNDLQDIPSKVVNVDSTVETEIKRAYRQLAEKIRTGGE